MRAALLIAAALLCLLWGAWKSSIFDYENWGQRLDHAEMHLWTGGMLLGVGFGLILGAYAATAGGTL